MISNAQLIILLGLSGIEMERAELTADNRFMVHVKSVEEGCRCHRCGKPIGHCHGLGPETQLRHLPIFEYKTYIVIRPKRYQCQACGGKPTTTQTVDWHSPKSHSTQAFEQDILLSPVNSAIQDVGIKHDIGQGAIEGMLGRHVQSKVDWDKIKSLEIIGIDEIALKKGHRDFVTAISACIAGKLSVLGILPDRAKATVKNFFIAFPSTCAERSRWSARICIRVS
jgi:transposase